MIADTCYRLQQVITDLHREIPEALAVADVETAAALLGFVRGMRQELQGSEGFAELSLAKKMPDRVYEWAGGRAVKRRTSTNVSWDNESVASAVMARALVDVNGELPGGEVQAAASRVKRLICDCAGFSYWRVGRLGELGIDADDYRQREPGRWVVDVDLASEGL